MQPQRKAKKDTPAPRRTHIACLPCCPSRPSSRARNEDTHGFPFLISALHPEDEDQSFNSLSDLVSRGRPRRSARRARALLLAACCLSAVRRSDRKQIPVNFREGFTHPVSDFVLKNVSGCACCGLLLCHSYSDRRLRAAAAAARLHACNAHAHSHTRTHAHTHTCTHVHTHTRTRQLYRNPLYVMLLETASVY